LFLTVNEVFGQMRDRVMANSAKVATLKASYQFNLTGEGGGTFHAVFDNGSVDVGEGTVENPGCTVTMSAPDFLLMVQGKLNPMAAFMGGKLKIQGDMGLAMRLQSIIG
jgi:putative sterol carrier protein